MTDMIPRAIFAVALFIITVALTDIIIKEAKEKHTEKKQVSSALIVIVNFFWATDTVFLIAWYTGNLG